MEYKELNKHYQMIYYHKNYKENIFSKNLDINDEKKKLNHKMNIIII